MGNRTGSGKGGSGGQDVCTRIGGGSLPEIQPPLSCMRAAEISFCRGDIHIVINSQALQI